MEKACHISSKIFCGSLNEPRKLSFFLSPKNLQLLIFRFPDTNWPPNDNPVPYCEIWTLVECIQQILDAYEICTGGKGVHQIMFKTHSASINWRK